MCIPANLNSYLLVPNFSRYDDVRLTMKDAANFIGKSKSTFYKYNSQERYRIPAPAMGQWWKKDLLFALEFDRLLKAGHSKDDAYTQARLSVEPILLPAPKNILSSTNRQRGRPSGTTIPEMRAKLDSGKIGAEQNGGVK